MNKLAQEFSSRVHAALAECHRLKYYPTRFEQMLQTTDAVTLAKRLVTSGELHDGLKTLKKLSRLDLSLEVMVLEPQFESLFTVQERDAAGWRLKLLK
jgi:hypothetical protein